MHYAYLRFICFITLPSNCLLNGQISWFWCLNSFFAYSAAGRGHNIKQCSRRQNDEEEEDENDHHHHHEWSSTSNHRSPHFVYLESSLVVNGNYQVYWISSITAKVSAPSCDLITARLHLCCPLKSRTTFSSCQPVTPSAANLEATVQQLSASTRSTIVISVLLALESTASRESFTHWAQTIALLLCLYIQDALFLLSQQVKW